ncbi:signal recognition particle subunit SRP72-like [Gigantopelta aegis]|uniref:signal recognition particle subunit SRP72-like n=1 Tax=Gigantopelta aegis TaxID=1735272 RepID=UPI001B8881D0|nr:signal recognition particle subunit SRP72-like [Gigantopelta aegis]
MAKPQETANLPSLYAELNRLGQRQEYEKAIKVSNKILHHHRDEILALHCKIVSLTFLNRFDEVLSLLNREKEFAKSLKFEKAYSEYRLNKTNEALKTLRSIDNPDQRSKELLAQVLYRLEDYRECYDLYKDIIKNSQDDFDSERETNLAAVVASIQMWDGEDMKDPGLGDTTYELCYNNACYYIGKKDYRTAEDKLRKAELSLREDTDLTVEELEEELAIIRTQLGFVLQQLKRNEEASKLYNQVLKNKPSDIGTVAVASNNIVTLNKDQNMFDSKRKMKVARGDNLKHKLTKIQKEHVSINQCLLHMYSNQSDQCLALAKILAQQRPDIDTPILIEAAQYARDKNITKSVEILQNYVKAHPSSAFAIQLVICQVYLSHGSVYQACSALKSLGELSYKPGIVSALVTLYLSQEDREAASETLVSAVEWYKKNKPKSSDLLILTRANANFQIKNGNLELAAKMLEDIRKSNPYDPQVLAQLISAYSQFNQAKAQQISKDLPPVAEIAKGIDVDALESSFSTLGPKYMKKTQKTEASPSVDTLIIKKKKKKKKKGKLPKNLETDGVIDPERWLPRRERSYFRGKRKDKRKDIGKGTQGSTPVAGEGDASKSPSGSNASSPCPGSAGANTQGAATTPRPGPRQQRPAQANKKKKKKGGKW